MIVDETVQEEAANRQDPIPRSGRRVLVRRQGSRGNALVPAEQVGSLDWGPCRFPDETPLTVETCDPVPGNDGVWSGS